MKSFEQVDLTALATIVGGQARDYYLHVMPGNRGLRGGYGRPGNGQPMRVWTWDKLTAETPMFVIESDATIVVPLMLRALLECKANPAGANALIAETIGA